MILKETLNNNASTAEYDFQGLATVDAVGTFNGATVTLEVSYDGGDTFVNLPSGIFTANSAFNVEAAACKIKATMTAANSSSVNVTVKSFRDAG